MGATHFLTHTCRYTQTQTQESHVRPLSQLHLDTESHGSKQRHHFMTGYLAPSVGHTGLVAEYSLRCFHPETKGSLSLSLSVCLSNERMSISFLQLHLRCSTKDVA